MEQKNTGFLIRRIGNTTCKVQIQFNETAGETMEDRLVDKEKIEFMRDSRVL